MQLDQARIEAAIVSEAVSKFINDDDVYERVKKGIDARIDGLFETRVSELIKSTVEAIAKDGFEREYTKRDGFGRPVGQPTSISKELENLVSGYWQTRVGRDGKPTDSSYSSMSRAEWMMVQICADDFSKEMKQHVVNVGGALKDHFREVLNQHVAGMLSDVFHVKSAGDVARNSPGRSCIDSPAKPVGSASQ